MKDKKAIGVKQVKAHPAADTPQLVIGLLCKALGVIESLRDQLVSPLLDHNVRISV
jgi:hypothetical protein